jgi:streptogramin lyase
VIYANARKPALIFTGLARGLSDGYRPKSARLALCLALAALAFVVLPGQARSSPTSITELSEGLNPGREPQSLVLGPDGNLWFTDQNEGFVSRQGPAAIGRIRPDGQITEFSEGFGFYSQPETIISGADGNLWFTEPGSAGSRTSIGSVTPAGRITFFTAGLNVGTRPRDIVAAPDGKMWFTATGEVPAVGWIGTDGTIAEFALPGDPHQIAIGPEGDSKAFPRRSDRSPQGKAAQRSSPSSTKGWDPKALRGRSSRDPEPICGSTIRVSPPP